MAPTRPSIMSLGATTSAPASAWLTAVRASSSRLRSLSTSPSTMTPQWPCDMYSQRQTSVSRTSSGNLGRSARSAICTIPSSSQAPVASSSFTSGTPNSSTARTPDAASVSTSRSSPWMSNRAMPGSSSFASGSGATKRGMTNWSSERLVSRTSPRSEAVRRKRRSRVMGNDVTRRMVRRRRLRQQARAVARALTRRRPRPRAPSTARARSRRGDRDPSTARR